MRCLSLLCAVLVVGCSPTPQALTSPCVGQPATGALGACPPCTTDADCKVLSNSCEAQAYCVHKDSSWTVNPDRTCTTPYPPTTMSCRCLGNVCDWHW